MSLFEFNLEKPAFKRVMEPDRTDATDDEARGAEMADGETTEGETTDVSDGGGSRRRPGRRTLALLAVVVAVLAVRRLRS